LTRIPKKKWEMLDTKRWAILRKYYYHVVIRAVTGQRRTVEN